jgi:hypothetical protein
MEVRQGYVGTPEKKFQLLSSSSSREKRRKILFPYMCVVVESGAVAQSTRESELIFFSCATRQRSEEREREERTS